MIKWLLDTNACIAVMNEKPPSVRQRLVKKTVSEVGISTISLHELQYGVFKSARVAQNKKTLDAFLKYIQVLDWADGCAKTAGRIRSDLEKNGNLIGPYDILIAAHAVSEAATLVTHNTKEFSRVNGIKLIDWFN